MYTVHICIYIYVDTYMCVYIYMYVQHAAQLANTCCRASLPLPLLLSLDVLSCNAQHTQHARSSGLGLGFRV